MIAAGEVQRTLDGYLTLFPDERKGLALLTTLVGRGAPLSSRKEFAGHITVGAVVIDPLWRVLHIHHRAIGRWLLPGGHLEARDQSLIGASLRELKEETGIEAGRRG